MTFLPFPFLPGTDSDTDNTDTTLQHLQHQHQQTIQRSPYFVEILERYGGELPVLTRAHRLFKEEAARRQAREESGAADPLQPYFVVEETLAPVVGGAGAGEGVLHLRMTVLTEGEQLLAYCQIREEGGAPHRSRQQQQQQQQPDTSSPISYIRR